ncbi:MAG: ParA family protein [Candidatus Woesearchaeota archaeon]
MRKICIINQKGGVGKTTTTISLASGLARAGKKILLIDFDAQGNIAASLHLKPQKTIYHLLIDGLEPQKCITPALKNIDVIASDNALHKAELILSGQPNREMTLKRIMNHLNTYDYILIDCPPTLNLLNYNALIYATEAIIPVSTDYLGIEGLKKMLDIITQIEKLFEHTVKVTAVIPTLYDSRSKICKESLEEIKNLAPTTVTAPIRINSKLKEAPKYGKPIFDYNKSANGAKDYDGIVQSLLASERTFSQQKEAKQLKSSKAWMMN